VDYKQRDKAVRSRREKGLTRVREVNAENKKREGKTSLREVKRFLPQSKTLESLLDEGRREEGDERRKKKSST